MDAEPPTHEGGLWPVAEWLSGGVEEVSHETTDAAIEALRRPGSSRRRPPKTWCSSEGARACQRALPPRLSARISGTRSRSRTATRIEGGMRLLEKTARATGTHRPGTRAAQLAGEAG